MRKLSDIALEIKIINSELEALAMRLDMANATKTHPGGLMRAIEHKKKCGRKLRAELTATQEAIDALLEARELCDDRGVSTVAVDNALARLGWN